MDREAWHAAPRGRKESNTTEWLNWTELNLTSWLAGPSLVAQIVKNLPAMRETWVQSLVWKDLLEKGIATHSSILAWRITWTEEPNRLGTVHGVTKSWTQLSNFHFSWLAIATKKPEIWSKHHRDELTARMCPYYHRIHNEGSTNILAQSLFFFVVNFVIHWPNHSCCQNLECFIFKSPTNSGFLNKFPVYLIYTQNLFLFRNNSNNKNVILKTIIVDLIKTLPNS